MLLKRNNYREQNTSGGCGVDGFCFSSGDTVVNTKFLDDRVPFGFATDLTISATFARASGLRVRNDPCVIFCSSYTEWYTHTHAHNFLDS